MNPYFPNFFSQENQKMSNNNVLFKSNNDAFTQNNMMMYNMLNQMAQNKQSNQGGKCQQSENLLNGTGRKEYIDGIYEGEFLNGMRHGYGKMKYTSGQRKGGFFEGHWVNDKREGQGSITYEDNEYYFSGMYKDDLAQGKGFERIKYDDGQIETYEGDFKNGKRHGKGIVRNSGKAVYYEGGFKDGVFDDYCYCKFIDGSTYKGEVKKGNFCGQGIYTCPNGTIIEGEFDRGQINGYAVKKKNGIIIESGYYKDNKLVREDE